ncbi:MAG TPA: hypothetical protein DCK87_04130 [Desulfotomaculum sp.]|nr:hypothetical protein [Desulfotomaculum sp.]
MYWEPQKTAALYLKGAYSYFDLQRSWIDYYTLLYQGWEEALSKFRVKMTELKRNAPDPARNYEGGTDHFASVSLAQPACQIAGRGLTFENFLSICLATLKEHFDLLLKSDLYVETQAKMLHSFMDTLKYLRDFWESLLMDNPALPFVCRTEIDTFYQRVNELRRKINVLERRTRNSATNVI